MTTARGIAALVLFAGMAGLGWVSCSGKQIGGTAPDAARAVRLSDGAHFDIPAPLGCGWSGWAGVIGSEIWAGVRFHGGNQYEVDSIVRVPLTSLGAPTP